MAIAENQTTYVLSGSGGAGLYFPASPIRVANNNMNTCTKITATLKNNGPPALTIMERLSKASLKRCTQPSIVSKDLIISSNFHLYAYYTYCRIKDQSKEASSRFFHFFF